MENTYILSRRGHMAEKVVFIDGQGGCGKTLFSSLIPAFDRVEKLTYAYDVETTCALNYLNNIDFNAAANMVRFFTDLVLYDTMMSREVNFRPSDLSSVFMDANPWRYFRRLFLPGDMAVPDRIKKERPILSLTVHQLLPIAGPVFEGLKDRAVFVEIVRHPLYMIIQQTLNYERLVNDAREFKLFIECNQKESPWYTVGWEDLFHESNPVEKSIHYMSRITDMTERSKQELKKKYNAQILTIPFESFVLGPEPYMKQMEELFGSRITALTRREMKKQKVPRQKISDGIPLPVYKRCGWVPPNPGTTEENELELRRKFALQTASPKAMNVLHQICAEYEKKYMGGRIIKGDHYE